MAAIGIAELLLILMFIAGIQKRISYGGVLLLHGISTAASYRQYLDPFNNLLFFTAWPVLATSSENAASSPANTRARTESSVSTPASDFTGRGPLIYCRRRRCGTVIETLQPIHRDAVPPAGRTYLTPTRISVLSSVAGPS
jgi:hypothetical protein